MRWWVLPWKGISQNRGVSFPAFRAWTSVDARMRPKNTGETLCLQHSDSGGEERMSQLSRWHRPKWREWNINDESVRAEVKDSNAAKPTNHAEWRAMLLLLRNAFHCCRWDAELEKSASLLHELMYKSAIEQGTLHCLMKKPHLYNTCFYF